MKIKFLTIRTILGTAPLATQGSRKLNTVLVKIMLLKDLLCNTAWISEIWKEVQANILKEPFVLLKQTIPQKKALKLSFKMTP